MGGCLNKLNKKKSFPKPTAIFWCLMPNPYCDSKKEVKTKQDKVQNTKHANYFNATSPAF